MKTVGIRELKQNPQAVINHVEETGEEMMVTVYGKPTDVIIRRKGLAPRRWVKGDLLNKLGETTADIDGEQWLRDILDSPFAEDFDDPWGQPQ